MWQGQSHASPGGGVGTNFVKARSRLGSPRMPQLTTKTRPAEGTVNGNARSRVNYGVAEALVILSRQARDRDSPDRGASLPGRSQSRAALGMTLTGTTAILRCARDDKTSIPFPPMIRLRALVAALQLATAATAVAQTPVVIRGGWIFTATSDQVVRNRGILVRGSVFQVVNGAIAPADTQGARVIRSATATRSCPA